MWNKEAGHVRIPERINKYPERQGKTFPEYFNFNLPFPFHKEGRSWFLEGEKLRRKLGHFPFFFKMSSALQIDREKRKKPKGFSKIDFRRETFWGVWSDAIYASLRQTSPNSV